MRRKRQKRLCATYLAFSGDTCRVEVAEELDDEEAERDEKSQRDEPAGSRSEIKGEKKKSL